MKSWSTHNSVLWLIAAASLLGAADCAIGRPLDETSVVGETSFVGPMPRPTAAVAGTGSGAGNKAPEAGAQSATQAAEHAQPTDLHPRPLGPKHAAAPTAPSAPSLSAAGVLWDNQIVRTGVSLGLVLGLIVVLAGVAKKVSAKGGGLAAAMGAGGKAPAGLLEVLGRYPISRGQTIVLLKLDSRILLLAQTQPRIRGGVGSLTTLCEVTHPEDVASILVKVGEHEGGAAAAKFSSLLHAFDRTHARDLPDHTEIIANERELESGEQESAAPEQVAEVVHKFPQPMASPFQSLRTAARPQSFASAGTDSFGSIRQRLHALRGEAHR